MNGRRLDRQNRRRLILIRHGESQYNVERRFAGHFDSPLSERGWREAELTARWLSENPTPDGIVSSPLSRAFQTATVLAKSVGLPLTSHPGLKEQNLGKVEQLTLGEAADRFPDYWQRSQDPSDPDFGWPGGETRRQFFARVRNVFRELLGDQAAGDLVVVSHGGVISAYLSELLDGSSQFDDRYQLDNCSVTIVEPGQSPPVLVDLNNTTHLNSHSAGDASC